MSRATLDVTGIGNPIVDIIFRTDEATIIRLEMPKATMTLINLERSEQLRQLTSPRLRLSGGSAGNTIAGLASLGAKVGYIGKVGDDKFGDAFRRFCASSSAKGGHLSWGYAAWRIWVVLCSLRSFMLR